MVTKEYNFAILKTHKTRIYPNKHMQKVINESCDYGRYCYNKGLAYWNDMYDASIIMNNKKARPNFYEVQKYLYNDKADWEYNYSSRIIMFSAQFLKRAWEKFFNSKSNGGKPKFKSKRASKQSFTTDNAKVAYNKLILERPKGRPKDEWYPIKMAEPLRFKGAVKQITISRRGDKYYAAITVATDPDYKKAKKNGICGVDVNIKHFDYNDGQVLTLPDSLARLYSKINYYQKSLANKRNKNTKYKYSHRYQKTRTKLKVCYEKVQNIQHDIVQKFTSNLVKTYPEIHIEDLNVDGMKMNKHLSKSIHRSMFGYFKQVMQYKCAWNGRKLVLVDKFYPSTQKCSECGYIKTKDSYGGKQTLSGDSIHHDHQKYYCYNCGAILDRDMNAVQNLINYSVA